MEIREILFLPLALSSCFLENIIFPVQGHDPVDKLKTPAVPHTGDFVELANQDIFLIFLVFQIEIGNLPVSKISLSFESDTSSSEFSGSASSDSKDVKYFKQGRQETLRIWCLWRFFV